MKKLKIGISIGDFNGIGLEVIIKTFTDSRMLDFCTPVIYGSFKLLSSYRKSLTISDFSFNKVKSIDDINPNKVNIINCWDDDTEITFGASTDEAGKYSFISLEMATNDLLNNKIGALVTAPINKNNIQSDEFTFVGHTEYLTEKFEGESLMLMVSENLKVGIATNHIPINKIANTLNANAIFSKLKILNKSLVQDFMITNPRIAVLGLNPHAGDSGLLGTEEEQLIIPAINNAKSVGVNAFGPYAADGFFGSGNYKKFDAVLAMYHDQGLIPFKLLSFGEGINYTAGLNVVRTSPDHGVAYEIAGKDKALVSSFRSAIYLACDIYKNRKLSKEITENPLQVSKVKT